MKTRRMIASALAFIMATTVMSGSVFAAGEKVTISAQKTEIPSAGSFSIDIELSGVPSAGINACEFAISYDSHFMKVTGVEAGKITETGADGAESDISGQLPAFYADYSNEGSVLVTWCTGLDDKGYWITKDGVFMTITGVVAPGTTSGSSDIKIEAITRDNSDNKILIGAIDANGGLTSYDAAVSNGSITIAGASATTSVTTTATATQTTVTSGNGQVDEVFVGDVNLDGIISLSDIVTLNKNISNPDAMSPAQKANAECFADGKLDIKDSQALLKYIAGLNKVLPVTQ